MIRSVVCVLLFFYAISSFAQTKSKNFKSKTVTVTNDTIRIDSVSISPDKFKIFTKNKELISNGEFQIDFSKAILILDSKKYSEISIEYYVFPEFLTKTYKIFDENIIVPKRTNSSKLYSAVPQRKNRFFKPFDGLTTSGSISRGFTIGNNQDAVLNSNLDLQISGYLSDKVQLRASITDTNIPLQEGGFTQRLNQFDRVFIE